MAETSNTPQRPPCVLYGEYEFHQSLCFGSEDMMRGLDAEVTKVKECKTLGEAMALAPTLEWTWVPGIPYDAEEMEAEELSASDPYDWSETGPVGDGDWPAMPTAHSLETFEDDDEEAWGLLLSPEVGAEQVTTTLNGDYLYIPVANEPALLAAFTNLGVAYVRDDAVIENLGMV